MVSQIRTDYPAISFNLVRPSLTLLGVTENLTEGSYRAFDYHMMISSSARQVNKSVFMGGYNTHVRRTLSACGLGS